MLELTWRETLSLSLTRRLVILAKVTAALSPSPALARTERNVIYARTAGVDLPLDVFFPPGEGPWPIVLMIHGGGFIMGDKGMLEHTCRTFANAGFLVFNANYRLAP